jgi:hypothetical protein
MKQLYESTTWRGPEKEIEPTVQLPACFWHCLSLLLPSVHIRIVVVVVIVVVIVIIVVVIVVVVVVDVGGGADAAAKQEQKQSLRKQ